MERTRKERDTGKGGQVRLKYTTLIPCVSLFPRAVLDSRVFSRLVPFALCLRKQQSGPVRFYDVAFRASKRSIIHFHVAQYGARWRRERDTTERRKESHGKHIPIFCMYGKYR